MSAHHTPVAEIFGTHAWAYLPKFLNAMGVTVEQFQKLQFADNPALAKALLHYFITVRCPGAYKQSHITAAQLRRYKLTGKALNDVGQLMQISAFRIGDPSAIAKNSNAFTAMITEILNKAQVYDYRVPGEPYTEVRSAVRGTFSFNDVDYDYAKLAYRTVRCPECDHTNTVLADNLEDALMYTQEFTALSGPYCRCGSCDKVVRPLLEACDCLPEGWNLDDETEWDDYKDHLNNLLEDMKSHLKALGLPEPCQLALEINNANWRGQSATAQCEVSGDALAELLSVRGDFLVRDGELRVEANDITSLSCILAHHDATSGVKIFPVWECEMDSEELIKQGELKDAKQYAEFAELLLCGPHDCFEYGRTEGRDFKLVSRNAICAGIRELMGHLGYDHGPQDMEALMEEGTDNPALDLVAWNLFTIEDLILIKKLPLKVVAMHVVFVSRALHDHLNLENSDAT